MANLEHSAESMRALQADKEFNEQVLAICCSIIALGPAIGAIIIGCEYSSESICNENSNYFIDLKWYLLIAGLVSIGWVFLSCLIISASQICCCCHRNFNRGKLPSLFTRIFALPLLLFNFIYAIFGLYIYFNQMSIECQQEPIGQMLIAYCIIQVLFVGVTLCGLGVIYGEKCCANM